MNPLFILLSHKFSKIFIIINKQLFQMSKLNIDQVKLVTFDKINIRKDFFFKRMVYVLIEEVVRVFIDKNQLQSQQTFSHFIDVELQRAMKERVLKQSLPVPKILTENNNCDFNCKFNTNKKQKDKNKNYILKLEDKLLKDSKIAEKALRKINHLTLQNKDLESKTKLLVNLIIQISSNKKQQVQDRLIKHQQKFQILQDTFSEFKRTKYSLQKLDQQSQSHKINLNLFSKSLDEIIKPKQNVKKDAQNQTFCSNFNILQTLNISISKPSQKFLTLQSKLSQFLLSPVEEKSTKMAQSNVSDFSTNQSEWQFKKTNQLLIEIRIVKSLNKNYEYINTSIRKQLSKLEQRYREIRTQYNSLSITRQEQSRKKLAQSKVLNRIIKELEEKNQKYLRIIAQSRLKNIQLEKNQRANIQLTNESEEQK